MEINPSLARLRILEQVESVQVQREAAPDDELAGCPGCPYFWTCPVPQRAENVPAPAEIDPEDLADVLPARAAYRPRDADDIGWTDEWVDEDDLETDDGPTPAPTELPEDIQPSSSPRRRSWFRRR